MSSQSAPSPSHTPADSADRPTLHASDLAALSSSLVLVGITQAEGMFDYPLLLSRLPSLSSTFALQPDIAALDAASLWHHNARAEPKAWFQSLVLGGLALTIGGVGLGLRHRMKEHAVKNTGVNRDRKASSAGKIVQGVDANDAFTAASASLLFAAYTQIFPAFIAVAELQETRFTLPLPATAEALAVSVAKWHVVSCLALLGVAGGKLWRIVRAVGW
ncbi:hypothetical protein HDU93_000670 [Gonapodya sp. JEL0774]|nr:hypothetical protein HDU93_000670 [Gonapodya sp. JEL0774]